MNEQLLTKPISLYPDAVSISPTDNKITLSATYPASCSLETFTGEDGVEYCYASLLMSDGETNYKVVGDNFYPTVIRDKTSITVEYLNLIESQKEILAEKINEKYKYYLSIDGIPEDEYDEFVSLHEAYKSTGGNHHGDAKFNYCIKHLKVIPVITELKITAERVNEMTSKLID